ncbi:hypothetical protein C3K47_17840 [Solitalea longa]|uniref:Uncharacterized protein n=1 Tax=Solitalea longa TaxID=2079460 RepID=A0A2S4ZX70_9SPHI|nr:hypothetical protein C3K47_17840 [Solitalea longa]
MFGTAKVEINFISPKSFFTFFIEPIKLPESQQKIFYQAFNNVQTTLKWVAKIAWSFNFENQMVIFHDLPDLLSCIF